MSENDDFEVDDDDEDDEDDDYAEVSDEDDGEFSKRRRHSRRPKVALGSKSIGESKTVSFQSRRRKPKASFDYSSSAKNSDDDSFEEFNNRTKRSSRFSLKSSDHVSGDVNLSSHDTGLRTSSRVVRKVSYVESEESEEIDEEKSKAQKVHTFSCIFACY